MCRRITTTHHMSSTAVFCVTKSRSQGDRIIDRLHTSGFAYSEISVLMPETDSDCDMGPIKATKAPEGTVAGVATGGAAGGVLGLLAGLGALAIPGIGPLIAAGPLLAALSGAAIGAATGGVVGGLIGLGIPEIKAKIYGEKLRTGNYIVSVHTHNCDEVDRAIAIYQDHEAEDISTTRAATTPLP